MIFYIGAFAVAVVALVLTEVLWRRGARAQAARLQRKGEAGSPAPAAKEPATPGEGRAMAAQQTAATPQRTSRARRKR